MAKHEVNKKRKKVNNSRKPGSNPKTRKNVKTENSKDNEKTKLVKVPKNKNAKSKKDKKKHPKLILALKIFIILILLFCVALAGIVAAFFFGVFGNDFEITKEELVISASNSKIVDINGTVIADLSRR